MNVQLAHRIGFAAWAGLAVLQIVWHAWLLPPRHLPVAAALAIALVPLALPLLYWRAPQRALIAAAMVSLFYFCHGVAEAWTAPVERPFAWIEIILAVVLVLSCARKPRARAAVAIPSLSGKGRRAAPGEGAVLAGAASPGCSESLHRDGHVPSPQSLPRRERGSNQESP